MRKYANQKIFISHEEIKAMNDGGMSASEISRKLGVSGERIRQILVHPKRKPKKVYVPKTLPPEVRFHQNYKILPNGCWEWIKCKSIINKYGRFCAKGKHVYAHQFSWELYNGPIPKDSFVRQKCKNHSCVNPEHLILQKYRKRAKIYTNIILGESNL